MFLMQDHSSRRVYACVAFPYLNRSRQTNYCCVSGRISGQKNCTRSSSRSRWHTEHNRHFTNHDPADGAGGTQVSRQRDLAGNKPEAETARFMHSQRMGVPQGSPSDKWLSAKRRKWIPFKPALTDLAEHRVSDHFRHAIPFPRRGSTWWRFRMRRIVTTRSAEELRRT